MKERFLDYVKAVEFIIARQQAGEVWHMDIEIIENAKVYVCSRSERTA